MSKTLFARAAHATVCALSLAAAGVLCYGAAIIGVEAGDVARNAAFGLLATHAVAALYCAGMSAACMMTVERRAMRDRLGIG